MSSFFGGLLTYVTVFQQVYRNYSKHLFPLTQFKKKYFASQFDFWVWNQSPFYLPCKNLFFRQAANISSCWMNFLPAEELQPHAKNYECGYWCLQIWSRNLHNWHFLIFFVQWPKHDSSHSCRKCIFAAWKKSYAACTNKTSPWWKFSPAC